MVTLFCFKTHQSLFDLYIYYVGETNLICVDMHLHEKSISKLEECICSDHQYAVCIM